MKHLIETKNLTLREFKDTDIDYQRVWDVIHDIMVDNNINIEDLVD